uniref:Uncharacterized protein n=1 Tax=Anguilla anguilla TaxID=7936 RepID=A0A0E9PGU2_ANGAN
MYVNVYMFQNVHNFQIIFFSRDIQNSMMA